MARPGALTVVAMGDDALSQAVHVTERLSSLGAITWVHDATSAAAACPTRGACVIVSTGAVPQHVTAGAQLLGVMKVAAPESASDARITAVDAPLRIHRNDVSSLRVQTTGTVKQVDVFDGETLVGSAEAAGQPPITVPWIPIAGGARVLRVAAGGSNVDVGVVVESTPAPVLFYEPRATWLGTFVRRSLADDARFAVRGRTRVAPPVAISRGDVGPLTSAAVDPYGVIILSAPDLATTSEVELLERFVTRRGGTLIALTDQRPSGAALRLLPRVVAERREPEPRTIGLLRASEWLTFASSQGLSVLAAVDQHPVVVSRALGRGRVIVSGALDAWRYRQASDGFDDFWRAAVWNGAMLAGPALRVETDRVIARPGEEIMVTAELQAVQPLAREAEAAGVIDCGDDRQFLRLWPGAQIGTFTGRFRAPRESACIVSVTIGAETGTTPVTFRDDLNEPATEDGALEALAAAHGALLASDAALDDLVGRAEGLTGPREALPTYPMRSPYWLVPFVACLGAEWWLRRRSGLS